MYHVKEIYYTLQGEGFHSGRAAIFCRFSGCNLWSGREKDRQTAICKFCDTDFWGIDGVNGGKYSVEQLVQVCSDLWPTANSKKFIVFTGGEPALQLNQKLIDAFHDQNFELAIETNGTIELPSDIDWICVSPKANTDLVVRSGNELKFVYPQNDLDPEQFLSLHFDHFYIQPMDGPQIKEYTLKAVEFCQANPIWKLSLQTHKLLGIP